MVNEAIVLSGGLGTRLGGRIGALPKPMAPVNNKPFLEYILDHLVNNGINRIILSTGYKSEVIEDYFGSSYRGSSLVYSVEESPLGTGGAVRLASKLGSGNDIIIVNGDTLFKADIKKLNEFHLIKKADVSIALLFLNNTSRYGSVVQDEHNRIIGFTEKNPDGPGGLINGGIYIIRREVLSGKSLPVKFSLESDFFEQNLNELELFGLQFDDYFIDIGTPEDYERASLDLQ